MAEAKLLSTVEVAAHDRPDDCWVVIEDHVWDLTKFANEHPGGTSIIHKYAGRDATDGYLEVHSSSVARDNLDHECYKGKIDRSTISAEWEQRQKPVGPKTLSTSTSQIIKTDERPPLHTILNSADFEEVAAKTGPQKAFAFYSTADTDCWTRDANQSMLKRIWFRPRIMRDVSTVNLSSTILNIPVSLPLFICPTGLAKLINPEAEKDLARASKATGILECISSSASYPVEEIVREAPNYPFLFQLYLNKDRSKSATALQRARSLGMKAIFITVDAAGRGKRESDERYKVDDVIVDPVTGEAAKVDKRGGGLTRMSGGYIDQGMTWADLTWVRKQSDLPIVLKGITCAEDAKLAADHKVDGILLSNHGGRNLDYSPPSILLLLEMHKNCPEIFDKMEVYIDGGFRRGSDMLKALCLGAKAVGIGRTFLYALQYGSEGAEHFVEILKDEMESAMKLIGIKNLSEVHPGLLNTSDVDHLVPRGKDHPYAKWSPRAKL